MTSAFSIMGILSLVFASSGGTAGQAKKPLTAEATIQDVPKPSAVVMAYTGHSDYVASEPPTFAVVGERDGIAPPSAMEKRIEALRQAGTDVEFHRYADVGHGFGAGIGTSAEGWLDRAIRFWKRAIARSVK